MDFLFRENLSYRQEILIAKSRMSLKNYDGVAFANKELNARGNPAKIVFVDRDYSEEEMSAIALDCKMPATVFANINGDEAKVRYFLPNGQSMTFCGHGTLVMLHAMNLAGVDIKKVSILLDDGRSVVVKKDTDREFEYGIGMPISNVVPLDPESPIIEDIVAVTGLDRSEFAAFEGLMYKGDYVVKLEDAARLREIKIDKNTLLERLPMDKCRGVYVTARSQMEDFYIETRIFGGWLDDGEDIACGSANCTVIPTWYNHLGLELNKFRILCPHSYNRTGVFGGTQVANLT